MLDTENIDDDNKGDMDNFFVIKEKMNILETRVLEYNLKQNTIDEKNKTCCLLSLNLSKDISKIKDNFLSLQKQSGLNIKKFDLLKDEILQYKKNENNEILKNENSDDYLDILILVHF